jgi:hypothetical protein
VEAGTVDSCSLEAIEAVEMGDWPRHNLVVACQSQLELLSKSCLLSDSNFPGEDRPVVLR